MSGSELRTKRLFREASGNAFLVAFDRSLGGSVPFAEDSATVVESLAHSRVDGVLMSPGLIKRHAHHFGFREAPAIVARLDFPFAGFADRGSGEEYRLLSSAADAVSSGADAVVATLSLGYERQSVWADNVTAVSRLATETHALGVPLVVEAVAWGPMSSWPGDEQPVLDVTRIAVELGADLIKTEWLGSVEAQRRVVEVSAVPVLTLGGPLIEDIGELTRIARSVVQSGAKGIIWGRNVWQRADARQVTEALLKAVHDPSAELHGA